MPQKQYADCKRAALHLIDHVQSSGALVAISHNTGLICACSDNISQFIGHLAPSILNKPWQEFLQPAHVSSIYTSKNEESGEIAHVHTGQYGNNTCDIANHSHNGITYVRDKISYRTRTQFQLSRHRVFPKNNCSYGGGRGLGENSVKYNINNNKF